MTTLEMLAVTWIYIYVTMPENPALNGYIERPGFLIGDRVSIDHLTLPVGCIYGPDDAAVGYESAGWYVALMGRLIAKTEDLNTALIAANALDAFVQQGFIHGSMKMHRDELYIEFDGATVDIIHEAVERALAA
jgi:hypothetical protein